MKRKPQYAWLLITNDKYELPLAVADTSAELAKILGVSERSVSQCFYRFQSGKAKTCKYRKVKIN